jgi:hypothetical protein
MVQPSVAARIKKWHSIAAERIDSDQIRSFMKIAPVTSEGKITASARSAMLFRDDVLDMMRESAPLLIEKTVFAPIARARSNEFPRGGVESH